MDIRNIKTIGALKKSGYVSRSVKEEIRENLVKKLRAHESSFNGIIGYEETVIPQIENAREGIKGSVEGATPPSAGGGSTQLYEKRVLERVQDMYDTN